MPILGQRLPDGTHRVVGLLRLMLATNFYAAQNLSFYYIIKITLKGCITFTVGARNYDINKNGEKY